MNIFTSTHLQLVISSTCWTRVRSVLQSSEYLEGTAAVARFHFAYLRHQDCVTKLVTLPFLILLICCSSPIRTPLIDNEIVLMNTLYQERFPKATHQMEEKLNRFILDHESLDDLGEPISLDHDNIAIVRFVHHQLIEMARDCLAKSRERLITSRYEMASDWSTQIT